MAFGFWYYYGIINAKKRYRSIAKEIKRFIEGDLLQPQNYDVLAGKDTIEDVMFYYLDSEEQFKEQIEEISKYLDLSSYGCVGTEF